MPRNPIAREIRIRGAPLWLVLVLVLVLVLAACGNIAIGPPPFAPEDLDELVLQQSEVPDPFVLDRERSGWVTTSRPPRSPTVDTPTRFESAVNYYLYRNFFTQSEMLGAPRIPEGTSQFLSHAAWYPNVQAAVRGLREQAGQRRPPGFLGQEPIPVSGLGSGAVRLELLPKPGSDFRSD
jgi:hypothetical protein